jgi:hypothetical protein
MIFSFWLNSSNLLSIHQNTFLRPYILHLFKNLVVWFAFVNQKTYFTFISSYLNTSLLYLQFILELIVIHHHSLAYTKFIQFIEELVLPSLLFLEEYLRFSYFEDIMVGIWMFFQQFNIFLDINVFNKIKCFLRKWHISLRIW